jgi:predicted dithiol-disulfide oxidoreductase (DUF899 family)
VGTLRKQQSPEYRVLRDELLAAETALKDQRERVAELRRRLGPGTKLETDYVFREGPADLSENDPSAFFDTRLSSLFVDGKDDLVVDHLMFAPDAERGCPMCSMWADGLDAVAHHLSDKVNFVLVARTKLENLRAWGQQRGWRRLRLLSSADNDFNPDLGVEISPDRQLPAFSVFTRDANGDVYHRYTTEGSLEERHHRAMDLYSPVWNVFDLLPGGRGDWFPKHFYDR